MTSCNRALLLVWLLASAVSAGAQDLSPRAFWPAPEGTRILTLGYSYTSGDTLTDPSLPITGINSDLNTGFAAFFQTFDLAGRTANVVLEQTYIWGNSEGTLGENIPIDRDLNSHGDTALTFAVNLLGAPTMDPEAFAGLRADPHPLLGVSLRIVAPTGSYNNERLINTGANRWAARTEVGYIYPLRPKWLLEFEAGAWFFDDNDNFLFGSTREQDPIYAGEVHLVHRFRPGFWASLDANYYRGGRTRVDGDKLDDVQRTSKFGLTMVFPLAPGRAVKLAYSGGSVSGSDNDFDTFLLSFNARLP